MNGHLGMTFDSRYRLNRNLLHDLFLLYQAAEKRPSAAFFTVEI
jgi:hypothetical protein